MNWLSIKNPLDCAYMDCLEAELGITLPEDYKSLIGPVNGGALKDTCLMLPQLGCVPYSRNVPLHRGAEAGIFDLIGVFNEGAVTLFPFAEVGSGDYFCFDLVQGIVVLWLHEVQRTQYVCDTFSQLLDSLVSAE